MLLGNRRAGSLNIGYLQPMIRVNTRVNRVKDLVGSAAKGAAQEDEFNDIDPTLTTFDPGD